VADTKYNPAKKFPAIIKQQKTKLDGERKRWAKWARWYRSEFFRTNDEDYELDGSLGVPNYNSDEITMEQNFVYSYCDTMVANIVPPNPQVTVQPRKEDLREAAKLREMLINDCLRRNKVHEKLWKLTTRASVWPRAFMKTVWNPTRRTPIFRVIDPKNIFFDNSVEEYEDIRYIIEVTVLTRGEFEKRANGKGRKKGIYNKEVADRATFGKPFGYVRIPKCVPVDYDLRSLRFCLGQVFPFHGRRSRAFARRQPSVHKPTEPISDSDVQ